MLSSAVNRPNDDPYDFEGIIVSDAIFQTEDDTKNRSQPSQGTALPDQDNNILISELSALSSSKEREEEDQASIDRE
jgi:hypothetical protein